MSPVQYKTVDIDSVKVFYREAASAGLPNLLLLHGHASASHTFRNIIPELSKSFSCYAPDYIGFGNSDRPDPKDYAYTFEHLSETIDKFTEQVGLTKFYLYIFDFGAPIGLTIASKHPERIAGIFTQSGNAYTEGLSPNLGNLKALWADPKDQTAIDAVKPMLDPAEIAWAYTHGVESPSQIAPDAPALDAYYTHRPGSLEIQLALLADYGNNVPKYPAWQAYLREHKPKVVGLWGRNDPFFSAWNLAERLTQLTIPFSYILVPPGAEAFKRDVPDADITIVDGAHFMNESNPQAVIEAVKKLL